MNKKNNRKGFTTVELVIVIAVIAILATVLIPTFSNLITKANESAALQEATNAVKTIAIHNADPDNTDIGDSILKSGDYYFGMINGQLVKASSATVENVTTYTIEAGTHNYTFTISNNAITGLKLGETEGYSVGTAPSVTDLTTKVTVYPIVAPTNP